MQTSPQMIQMLLERFYHGPMQRTDEAFLIRCPWHSDSNPSCNIFSKSGVFFCWSCHFGKNKGVGPIEGFKALGVPLSEIEKLSYEVEMTTYDFTPSSLLSENLVLEDAPLSESEQVLTREPWPRFWAWRKINFTTLDMLQTQARFNPQLVTLSTKLGPERLPRLGLTLANVRGGASEVFLRLSSEQTPKAVNAKGLDLKRTDILPLGFPGALRTSAISAKALMLVEGPYDAMRTYQHLVDLDLVGKVEVGAILGTGQWGHAWKHKFLVDYLPRFDGTLVLAFDADEAGFSVTRQVLGDLSLYWPKDKTKVLYWGGVSKAKDPGDLSLDEFQAIFRFD